MILLLTNSRDVTTDILMPYLTSRAEVFRFNIDLWRDYTWSIQADGYTLSDPVGRVCREKEVGAVYERKVMFWPPKIDTPAGGSQEAWLREEVFRIWAALKDLAMGSGKLALIHPSPSGNWYKCVKCAWLPSISLYCRGRCCTDAQRCYREMLSQRPMAPSTWAMVNFFM